MDDLLDPSLVVLQSVRKRLLRSDKALAWSIMDIRKLSRVFTRHFDEPGKSREAQELTCEIPGLSMRRTRTKIINSQSFYARAICRARVTLPT